MITEIEHERSFYRILPSRYTNSLDNVFTVVVGKNGIGKSRLLASLAKPTSKFQKLGNAPFDRVIAVSTSPFDKFPMPHRDERSEQGQYYKYVGMRRGFATTSSISLISSAARSLLLNSQDKIRNHKLIDVFNLLELNPEIDFAFKIQVDDRFVSARQHNFTYPEIPNNRYYHNDEIFTSSEIERARSAIEKLLPLIDGNGNFSLSYYIDEYHVRLQSKGQVSYDLLPEVLFLYEKNLIKLMDMRLFKYNVGQMSLRRASSGEQCILVSILGIAGHIKDNALILIDEPEISLHPEWQEKYIRLLINSFSHYRKCQFVIATHSPQIVANLPERNCFVLSLATNELNEAGEYSNKSSDYQLAELFKSPGISNEYLNRLALNIFAKVSKFKKFDFEDSNNLSKLNELSFGLDQDGPLIELIKSLEIMRDLYSYDK